MGILPLLLRMARRSVTRARIRSLLIVALIALAVAVGTATAVGARTARISDDDQVTAVFGTADLRIDIGPGADELAADIASPVPVLVGEPAAVESGHTVTTSVYRELPDERAWLAGFDADGLVASLESEFGVEAAISRRSTQSGREQSSSPFNLEISGLSVAEFDPHEPLSKGRARLVEGRWPEAADEMIALTGDSPMAWAEIAEADLSQRWTATGTATKDSTNLFRPGVLVSEAGFEALPPGPVTFTLLLSTDDVAAPTGDLLEHVHDRAGRPIAAIDRDRRWDRTDRGDWIARPYELDPYNSSDIAALRAGSTFATALVGAQVALVAAAAWAVSIRRRLVDFGHLLVTGATPRQVRQVVLVEALALGLVAVAVGVVTGIGAVALGVEQGWLNDFGERIPDRVRFEALDVVGPALVGLAASVAAAWWPSKVLNDLAATTALAGRLPMDEPGPYIPRTGALVGAGAVIVFGLAPITFVGTAIVGTATLGLVTLAGGVAVLLAVFMVIGAVLSWVSRSLGDRLPAIARLVVRTADRQRSRTWVVIASLVAVLSLPVFVGASIKAYPDSYRANDDTLVVLDRSFHRFPRDASVDGRYPGFLRDFDAAVRDEVPVTAGAELVGFEGGVEFWVGPQQSAERIYSLQVVTDELANALGADGSSLDQLDATTVVRRYRPERRDETLVMYEFGAPVASVTGVDLIRSATLAEVFIWQGGEAIIGEEFAAQLPKPTQQLGAVWVGENPLTTDQRVAIRQRADELWWEHYGALADAPTARDLHLQLAPTNSASGPEPAAARMTVLAITTGVAALIALATSALAATEWDREISAMVAIGARPVARRLLLAGQTWYSMTVAAVVAVPVAILLFWAATARDQTVSGLTVPWSTVATVLVVVPAVVALAIGAVFRNGRPSVSRRVT